jgi:hypothetical protein
VCWAVGGGNQEIRATPSIAKSLAHTQNLYFK